MPTSTKPTNATFTVKLKHIWALLTKPAENRTGFLDYHMVRRKYIMRQACLHFKKNKHEPAPLLGLQLLDIGCGDSTFAAELCFRGADVLAVDTNKQLIEQAEQQANQRGAIVEFTTEDATSLVAHNKKYDIILCLDILENATAQEKDKLIWAMHKMLNTDGIIIFSTISSSNLAKLYFKRLLEQLLHWFPKGYFTTKHFISHKELKKALSKHNLKVTTLQGVFFDPQSKFWHRQKDLSLRYMGVIKHK